MASEIEVLSEILNWMRFQNRQALKATLEDILTTRADKIIYEFTDGRSSQPDIAKRVGVSQPTVSNKWKAWRAFGIVYEVTDETGRCRHLASLRSLGMDVPGSTE